MNNVFVVSHASYRATKMPVRADGAVILMRRVGRLRFEPLDNETITGGLQLLRPILALLEGKFSHTKASVHSQSTVSFMMITTTV